MGREGKTFLLPGVRVENNPRRPPGLPLTDKIARTVLVGSAIVVGSNIEIGCRVRPLGADAHGLPACVLGCFGFGVHNPGGATLWSRVTRTKTSSARLRRMGREEK